MGFEQTSIAVAISVGSCEISRTQILESMIEEALLEDTPKLSGFCLDIFEIVDSTKGSSTSIFAFGLIMFRSSSHPREDRPVNIGSVCFIACQKLASGKKQDNQ